jgi:outer membrane protein W
MKKLFISSLLLLAVFISAKAQTVSLGPTIGVGNSWLTNTGASAAFKPAMNAGVTLTYSSTNHWGLGGDIKYSVEGNRNTYMVGSTKFSNIIRLDYIRVPFRVLYFFGTEENVIRPKLAVGPTLGFLANARYILRDDTNGNIISNNDFTSNKNAVDFGINASAGLNIKLADRIWLNTDFSFYQGFIPVNTNGPNRMLNGNVGLNVGLAFGLGK